MSLVNPSIDKLVNQVDNKYTLCMLAAKRAREIGDVKAKAIKKARKLNESKSAKDKNMAKLIITIVNAAGKEVSPASKQFEAGKISLRARRWIIVYQKIYKHIEH